MRHKKEVNSIQIIPFSDKHLEEASELYKSVFNQKPWSENWTSDNAKNRLSFLHKMPTSLGLSLLKQETLIGFLIGSTEPYLNHNMLHLKELCICPNHQKNGYASKLLKELNQNCINLQIKLIYLVTKKTTLLKKFYNKNNYIQPEKNTIFIQEL